MRNTMRPFALCAVVLALAVGGCKKKTSDTGEPSPPAPAGSDRARLQGMWAIETVDSGRPERDNDREDTKNVRLKFDGDTLTIDEGRSENMKFTFVLDETKTPKVLVLTETGDGPRLGGGSPTRSSAKRTEPEPPRERKKWSWIYKFEGDALVVAFAKDEGDGPPPTEFKGKKDEFGPNKRAPGVMVTTLKKTDVPAPPRPTRPNYTTATKR